MGLVSTVEAVGMVAADCVQAMTGTANSDKSSRVDQTRWAATLRCQAPLRRDSGLAGRGVAITLCASCRPDGYVVVVPGETAG